MISSKVELMERIEELEDALRDIMETIDELKEKIGEALPEEEEEE